MTELPPSERPPSGLPPSGRPGTSGDTPGKTPVGSVVMLCLGLLLLLLGIGPIVAGATLTAIAAQQDSAGFISTPAVPVTTDSYALVSPELTVTGDIPQLPFDLGTLRLAARGERPSDELFLGIARTRDVERYLAGVHHTEVRDIDFDPLSTRLRERQGPLEPEPPQSQSFWIDSDSGSDPQLQRRLETGDVTVVLMNADGSAGVRAELAAGVRSDLFAPAGLAILLVGLLFVLIGIPLVVFGARGLGGAVEQSEARQSEARQSAGLHPAPQRWPGDYPAVLTAELDGEPSRWLWLVKWVLLIPHYVLLAFLWIAFWVTSVVVWFAILFTGRYPRSLFAFNVGVLRWNWRVAFYGYSALGTDRYPPFTLAATDYPADFSIEYPERLSRGLVLVKSWLLALPHLLLIAAVTGAGMYREAAGWSGGWGSGGWSNSGWGDGVADDGAESWDSYGIPLLGILVTVVGVILLFTGRYPRAMFDLLMGINRWGYRVAAYAGLFRDEYPPFRLDQGPGPVRRAGGPVGGPVGEPGREPGREPGSEPTRDGN
jgi:hypothetical protein